MIAALTALDGVVVATGGGAVLDPENRERLSATGTVIYLEATVDAQLRRTQPSRSRPLLKGGDPRAILERLMSIRRPLYESIADIRIDTTGRQVRRRRIGRAGRSERKRLAQLQKPGRCKNRERLRTFAPWTASRSRSERAAIRFISDPA